MDAGQAVLRRAIVQWHMTGGVLYERRGSTNDRFEPSAVEGLSEQQCPVTAFSGSGLLPRWLRVNLRCIAIPDTIGVFDAIAAEEQQELLRIGTVLAVPLVHNQSLIGWIALSGPPPEGSAFGLEVPEQVHIWATDLTNQRQIEEARARAGAIAQSNRLSLAGKMAAGIAHEVRNPLAAVRSIVQLVRDEDVVDQDRPRLLSNAMAEIDRVNSVLTGMLTLGRPNDARVEAVELGEVLLDALSICDAYARSHGQTIHRTAIQHVHVMGDRHELRQVFVNVLLNACQASTPGGIIYAEIDQTVDASGIAVAVVRIRDSGAGIPQAVVARVFEPFFTTKTDGGGLGLALCREAMYRHNGEVLLSSEEGVGTVVTIRLPMRGTDGENPGR